MSESFLCAANYDPANLIDASDMWITREHQQNFIIICNLNDYK